MCTKCKKQINPNFMYKTGICAYCTHKVKIWKNIPKTEAMNWFSYNKETKEWTQYYKGYSYVTYKDVSEMRKNK